MSRRGEARRGEAGRSGAGRDAMRAGAMRATTNEGSTSQSSQRIGLLFKSCHTISQNLPRHPTVRGRILGGSLPSTSSRVTLHLKSCSFGRDWGG